MNYVAQEILQCMGGTSVTAQEIMDAINAHRRAVGVESVVPGPFYVALGYLIKVGQIAWYAQGQGLPPIYRANRFSGADPSSVKATFYTEGPGKILQGCPRGGNTFL